MLSKVAGGIQKFLSSIWKAIKEAAHWIREKLQSVFRAIRQWVQESVEWLSEKIGEVWDGFKKGVAIVCKVALPKLTNTLFHMK